MAKPPRPSQHGQHSHHGSGCRVLSPDTFINFFPLEVEDPKVNKAKYLTKSAFSFSVMADLACDSLENMEMFSENVSQCESLFEGNQNPSSSKDTHATDNELPPLDNTTTNYGNPPATQTKSKVSMDLNSAARAIGYYDRLDRLLDKLESRFHRALSKSNFSEEENFVLPEDIAQRKVASGEESCSKCGNQLRQQKSKEEPESDRKDAEMNNLVSSKIVPKVKECDWEHFVNRFSETEEICAIEVLLAGPELGKDVADEDDKRSFRRSSGPHNSPPPRPYARDCDSLIQATHKVYKVKNESQWVHRVRIQSSALLQIFSKVSGYVWGSKAHTFVRPFKYLIFFHEKFKNELQQMEMESLSCERTGDQSRGQNQEVDLPMASTTNTGKHSSTKTTHSTSNSQRNTKSLHGSDALDDLRCYIDFAEEKLIPQYKRFQAGNCSTTTKIRFDDLWYLFRPGELIYLPKKTLINAANLLKTDMNIISTGDNSHESSLFQQIWRVHIGQAPPVQLNVVGEDSDPDSVFSITCHYLDYDGSSYRPVTQSFWIPSFKGEREITELDFYPLRFAEGGDRILRNHQQQGRLFTERLSQWHLSYEGWTFVTDPIGVPIPDTDKNYAQSQLMQRRTEHIEGEVIVDFGEAFNSYPFYKQSLTDVTAIAVESTSDITESPHPIIVWANSRREWQISESREAVIWNDDCDLQEYNVYLRKDPYLGKEVAPHIVPDGDDLALLPPRLFVYSLQQQLFVPVNVRYLKPIPVSCSDAFSHLQLPDDHKRIIQAAVHSHLRRHQIERKIQSIDDGEIRTQDFILSKGRGLLIMLHGEPGVGKTATAEAVSQSTQRPLFSISCSTLQNYRAGKSTEERIMEIFRLAHLWDCVLLMDEADVFLSSRSLPGGRDSMVSIFLRVLEYYNGILFLTTNRIGKLDPAISSRIHIILHYKRLGRVEIENIFRLNIKRLQETEQQQHDESGEPALFVMEDDILRFAADHCKKNPNGKGAWNGRQIRNAFMTAASLARYEAEAMSLKNLNFQPQLRYSHFQEVERIIADYDRFRANVLGGDDSRRARLNEERDDDYDWDEEDRGMLSLDGGIGKARQMYSTQPQQSGISTRATCQGGHQKAAPH